MLLKISKHEKGLEAIVILSSSEYTAGTQHRERRVILRLIGQSIRDCAEEQEPGKQYPFR